MRQDDEILDTAYTMQLTVLYLLQFVHAVATIVLLRSWPMAIIGTLLPIASARLGRLHRSHEVGKLEPLMVWFAAAMVSVLVSIFFRFPFTAVRAGLIAINIFVILGAWAIHRMPAVDLVILAQRRRPFARTIRYGLLVAFVFSIYATLILGGAEVEEPGATSSAVGALIVGYFGAGVLGGAVVALLWPLTAWPLGRMVVGIPAAGVVYGAVGVAMAFLDADGPVSGRAALAVGVIAGLFAGPAGGLMIGRVTEP